MKTNYLLQMLSKVLESMQNVSILFNNMGSPDVCVLNKTIVRKLIDLKNTHAYSKGMMINIQGRQMTLFQSLHNYSMTFCLANNADYEEVIKDYGLFQQDIYDKVGIISKAKNNIPNAQLRYMNQ